MTPVKPREENTWNDATTCEKVDGPCELIRRDEILKDLRITKKGKAASPRGIVSEMFMAEEDCNVQWLTSLCNLIVAQGRIPDEWKSSILIPVFKGKGDPIAQFAITINSNVCPHIRVPNMLMRNPMHDVIGIFNSEACY